MESSLWKRLWNCRKTNYYMNVLHNYYYFLYGDKFVTVLKFGLHLTQVFFLVLKLTSYPTK
jgi:hypothetical protein